MIRKGLGFLFGVAVLLCLLAADLAPYRGLVAKYGTIISSPDVLRFVAAKVSESYGVTDTSQGQFRLVMLCNSCETQQPEGLRETVLYNETVNGITFSLYSFDADHSMREFAKRRLFLVANYKNQLSYLELPSSETFGHCQQQSRLVKANHPFKNSIWIEMMIPSQSTCGLRLGSRQTTRYGVLLKVEKGQLRTLLDAIPIQQSEWAGFSSTEMQRPILQLQVAFWEDNVEIRKSTANISNQQRSWIGTHKIK